MDPVDAMCVCVSCGRRPRGGRFLKCLHVACGACMDEHTDSEGARLCPRCTSTTESQPSGRLPRVPEGLVEYCEQHVGHSQQEQGNATPAHDDKGGEETERERQAKSLCDECVDDSKAAHRCADCSFLLCDDHASGHGRKRAYAGHQVEPWQAADNISVVKGQPPKKKIKVATMCMLHPQRAVVKFCMTCDQPFCKRCLEAIVGSCCCNGSCVQDAAHSAVECLANLRRKFGMPATEDTPTSLRPQLLAPGPYVPEDNVAWNVHFENYQDELENKLDTVTELHQTLSEEITSAFAEVRESIAKQEATLRARLDQVIWRIMKPIEEQKETARHTSMAMERATRLFQLFSETGTDKLPLLLLSKWLKDLHARQEKESGQKPCITPKVTFVPIMRYRYFDCAINEQTTAASPSSFKVEILPPTDTECPVWVGVVARNADNTPLLCNDLSPDDDWCVSISSGIGTSDQWRFSQLSLSSPANAAVQQAPVAASVHSSQLRFGTSKYQGGSSGQRSLSSRTVAIAETTLQHPQAQQLQAPQLGTSKSPGASYGQRSLSSHTGAFAETTLQHSQAQQLQAPQLGTSKSPGGSYGQRFLSSHAGAIAETTLQQSQVPQLDVQQLQAPQLGTSKSPGASYGQRSLSSHAGAIAETTLQHPQAQQLQALQLGTSKSPGGSYGQRFLSSHAGAIAETTLQQPQVPQLDVQQLQAPQLGTSKSPGASYGQRFLSSHTGAIAETTLQHPQAQQVQAPQLGTSKSPDLSLGPSAPVQQTSSSAHLVNPSNLSLQHIQCRPSNDVRKADLQAPTFDAVFYIPKRYFCRPIEIQVCLNGKAIGNGQTHTMNIAYSIASQGIP